jgi:hypothetical protein
MTLQITRDDNGIVTITNPATGKSEVLATGIANRPAQKLVHETTELPSHQWGRAA